jgi:hypothetical protein
MCFPPFFRNMWKVCSIVQSTAGQCVENVENYKHSLGF